MIEADVFRELELEGALPPSRADFILSASCWLLELLLTTSGIDFYELDELLLRGPLRIHKKSPVTPNEVVDKKNDTTEQFFRTLYQFYHEHEHGSKE